MQYILGSQVVLRGYQNMPYSYYFRGLGGASSISQKEFCLLKKMYVPYPAEQLTSEEHEESRRLLRLGLIKEYRGGETVQEYQKYRFCSCPYTPNVNWAVTGRCNYNCLHCFNAGGSEADKEEFSKEQAYRLIDEFSECGIINVSLTGGEPMLHPDFLDIVRYINQKGMAVREITTNGSFLTQELLDSLSGYTDHTLFKISFDGFGYHDWLRNKAGAEQEALQKISLLLKNNCRIQIQTNLHKKNKDSMQKTAEIFDSMGVEYMRIIRTSESPRWNINGRKLSLTLPEYFAFALDFATAYAENAKNMQANIWQVIEIRPRFRTYRFSGIRNDGPKSRGLAPVCRTNQSMAAVTPHGEVVPCSQMSGWMKLHHISLGNVKEKPLKEILTGSAYRTAVDYPARELFSKNPHICGTCRWRDACLGGCRACAILLGSCENVPGLEGMDAYYGNYDPVRCLFFKEYIDEFQKVFRAADWQCDNKQNSLLTELAV